MLSQHPLEAYRTFARYYPELIRDRKHSEPQVCVVRLLSKTHGRVRPRVLDAACGTGEVLAALLTENMDAYGTDGSSEMLAGAASRLGAARADRLLAPCPWEDLSRLAGSPGPFDIVIVLGHALPHAEAADLPKIFDAIECVLAPGGVLAFDIRAWEKQDGHYVQPGRDIGTWSDPRRYTVDGQPRWVAERCDYDHARGRQCISYSLKSNPSAAPSADCVLEYTLAGRDEFTAWILDSRFGVKPTFGESGLCGSSYVIVTVTKPGRG